MAQDHADQGPAGDPGAGRECRRHRHRRRRRHRLQDGEPQSSLLHRALPGCRHRRGRHPARRLHHGGKAHRGHERAALRRAFASQDAAPGLRRGAWHRRLRQFLRRAHHRRRGELPSALQRQHPGQRHGRGPGARRLDLLFQGQGRGPAGGLSRRQDRRDGIHGATMASAEFDDKAEEKRPRCRWAIRSRRNACSKPASS